jgi:hypothetical protein
VLTHYRPHWKTVIDAREPLVVKITKEDMAKANPQDPDGCAANLACKKAGLDPLIYHHRSFIAKKGETQAVRYINSTKLARAIEEYDKTGEWPAAGLYVLTPPAPTNRLGANAGRKHVEPRFKKGKTVRKHRSFEVRQFE